MKFWLLLLGGLCFGVAMFVSAALADTNATPCRVTVELRDGSRVVGVSVAKEFRFRSALLGDVKLAVPDIRSVECLSTNSARLTTSGGDQMTVSFAADDFALQTSFGKIKVVVASLRKLTVSPPANGTPSLPGLVALWSGEGDGKDAVGQHDAELTDVTFTDGKVGRAFSLDNDDSTIRIPGSSALDVGRGRGFTLTAWIKPSDVAKNNPIFEWVQEGVPSALQFYIYPPDGGPGTLYALMLDTRGAAHYFYSAPGAVVPDAYQFVALTYDKASGMGKIYCNGSLVAQQALGTFELQTSCDLYLGKRPLVNGETYQFNGQLDEAAIYNRALSISEIRAVATEDNQGEPLSPPPVRLRGNTPYFQ